MDSPSKPSREYRAYMLDKNDRIVRRIDIEASDENDALRTAQQYVDGHDVEVWTGHRFVRRLRHDK